MISSQLLQCSLSIQQRLPHIAASKISDLTGSTRRYFGSNSHQQNLNIVWRRWCDLKYLKPRLEAAFEIRQQAVVGAGDDNSRWQVIHYGKKAHLGNPRDFIRLINP
jgi:hypothetical protein